MISVAEKNLSDETNSGKFQPFEVRRRRRRRRRRRAFVRFSIFHSVPTFSSKLCPTVVREKQQQLQLQRDLPSLIIG